MPEFPGTLRPPRLASAPSSPVVGQMYYDTGTNVLYWWNGTTWVSASGGGGAATEDALQEGVIAATDCALTINSTSQITIAAGTVWVRSAAGVLTRVTPTSTVLSGIPACSASNFRLDQVVVSSAGVVSLLLGTQGTTVTLANRTGAAAIPAGSRLLWDSLETSIGVPGGNQRDRRPWARGAFWRTTRTTNDTTTSATLVQLAAAQFVQRIECSGVPVRVSLQSIVLHSVANSLVYVVPWMDGADVGGGAALNQGHTTSGPSAAGVGASWQFTFLPTAGSHLFTLMWALALAAGTATLVCGANNPAILTIEEIVKANAGNGAT